MNKTWTNTEKQFLQDKAETMKDSEITAELQRLTGRNISVAAVRKQRQRMGLAKQPGRGYCRLRPKQVFEDNSVKEV